MVLAGQPWPEACLRPWLPWSPRAASCHPKGRSEAKELRDMNRLSVLEVNGPQMQYWTFEVDERRALLNSRTSMQ